MGIKIGKVIKQINNKVEIKLDNDLNINDGIRIIGENDTGCTITVKYKNGKKHKKKA